MGNLADDPVGQAYPGLLMQGLRALDWREGENLRIDWRWAGGDPALFDRYATELVEFGADVLLAQSSPSVVALRRKTSTFPSCLRWSPIRSARVLSKAWPVQAATSPASAISTR